MQTTNVAALDFATHANFRAGQLRSRKTLLAGQDNAAGNYWMGYFSGDDTGAADWGTPRHRHNFEQIRHPLTGAYTIAKDVDLPAGWVGYFPEGAYYGPQIWGPQTKMIALQFGGPSRSGYLGPLQAKTGFEALQAAGVHFENGAAIRVDANGKRFNQDSYEAIWEHMRARKLEYPKPRYDSYIMMNPASYDWVKDDSARGVAKKMMGVFTEYELKIGFIRLDPGATMNVAPEKAPQLFVLKEGAVKLRDETFPGISAFEIAAGETASFTAKDPSEFYYIKLPTL